MKKVKTILFAIAVVMTANFVAAQSSNPVSVNETSVAPIVDGKTSATKTFSNFGLAYITSVEAFDAGFYGLCGNIINDRKIGGQIFVGVTASEAMSGYAQFGPNYSWTLSDVLSFHIPLTFNLLYHENYGVTDDYEIYSKYKLDWGLSLSPSWSIQLLDDLYLNTGVALIWSEMSNDIDVGITLGIGFSM